jgi:hypothetical protein
MGRSRCRGGDDSRNAQVPIVVDRVHHDELKRFYKSRFIGAKPAATSMIPITVPSARICTVAMKSSHGVARLAAVEFPDRATTLAFICLDLYQGALSMRLLGELVSDNSARMH